MLTGGCQCGAVRYRVDAEPIRVYCCHCTECRAQSASAFGISVIVPAMSLALTQGAVKIWSRQTGSGKVLDCAFCPDCGTRLWHVNPPAGEQMSVKGGSVDGGVDLSESWHIWTSSKLSGVVIPKGARQFPRDHP